jgi:hypothetical protein
MHVRTTGVDDPALPVVTTAPVRPATAAYGARLLRAGCLPLSAVARRTRCGRLGKTSTLGSTRGAHPDARFL